MFSSLFKYLRANLAGRRTLSPSDDAAQYVEGNRAYALRQYEKAILHYDRTLSINPGRADAAFNRGNALCALGRFDEAITSYDRAIKLKPAPDAYNNQGIALQTMQRLPEALASFDGALALDPRYVDALNNRATMLQSLRRYPDAITAYEQLLAIAPDYPYALGALASLRATTCNWKNRAELIRQIADEVKAGHPSIRPLPLLILVDDPELQFACARIHAREYPATPSEEVKPTEQRHAKLRIAYISADIRHHAMAHLTAGLFERHDKTRFELIGVSIGPIQHDELRARITRCFDQFLDVYGMPDEEVAAMLRRLKVDIAVDMMGYTRDARPAILATRPAAVQVNYLAFPGTMGVSFIDYIIADEFILPADQQIYFSEKVAYLPDCYQANDSRRRIDEHEFSRSEAKLPQEAFVFCCFNISSKIAPDMFNIWMRLLRHVNQSVLWLLADNIEAERNLRHEASARGVDPARLVFAERVSAASHLARHRLADLFLDTLPYNAHTTASDALWAGLPVLTCTGRSFPSRVAGSLLRSVGLPELITQDVAEYEALALRLATDRALLHTLRERLAINIRSWPLFDTDRYCRNIENAYREMWAIHQRGERPRSFKVALSSG